MKIIETLNTKIDEISITVIGTNKTLGLNIQKTNTSSLERSEKRKIILSLIDIDFTFKCENTDINQKADFLNS